MKSKRFRILIAEKQKIVRETLKLAIGSSFECDVDLAGMGEEAVALALKNSYDILITNISLPDIEGLDVIKLIRKSEINNTILIVAITGYLNNQTKQRWIQEGINDFLIKPFTLADIRSVLKKFNFIA